MPKKGSSRLMSLNLPPAGHRLYRL